jgi:hypothetical protein
MLETGDLNFHLAQFGEHREGLLTKALVAAEGRLLLEDSQAQASKQDDPSAVGFFGSGGQSKDGGLPGAVTAHESDSLAGIHLEGDATEDFLGAV